MPSLIAAVVFSHEVGLPRVGMYISHQAVSATVKIQAPHPCIRGLHVACSGTSAPLVSMIVDARQRAAATQVETGSVWVYAF